MEAVSDKLGGTIGGSLGDLGGGLGVPSPSNPIAAPDSPSIPSVGVPF